MRKTIEFRPVEVTVEVMWKLPEGFAIPRDWKCKNGVVTDTYNKVRKVEIVTAEDAKEIENWVPNFEPDINHEYMVLTLNEAGDRKAFKVNNLAKARIITSEEK